MKNLLILEPDLEAVLLVNEEQVGNTIILNITTDDTADQRLGITKGDTALEDIELVSDAENVVELPFSTWALGKTTTIGLFKGEEAEEPTAQLEIRFPEILDTDSSLSGSNGIYKMQGSSSTDHLLEQLQQGLITLSAKAVDYILPSSVDNSPISDGSTSTILEFEFESKQEEEKASFYSQLTYDIETAVDLVNETYTDCDITVTYKFDGQTLGLSHYSYGDGDKILTLNYLLQNFSIGNHTFKVQITVAGGSLGTENFQILSAYLLAAASVSEGYVDEYEITDDSWSGDGEFYPDVLPEGLDNEDLTEEAMETGAEDELIKYALAPAPLAPSPSVDELSQWYNTKYMLCVGSYYAEPFYRTNGYYRKKGAKGSTTSPTGKPVGNTDLRFYIPIKRLTGYHFFKFIGKTIQNNGTQGGRDWNYVQAGVAYVDSGGVMHSVMSPAVASVADWTEYSVGVSTMPYIDYIILSGTDGSPAYKNLRFVR